MTDKGLKAMAGTRAPKFGHFIVEFATPGIGHILKSAGCDLIAMSTHGHRLIGDLILGSVASEVRHRTDIPVLLLRAPASRQLS